MCLGFPGRVGEVVDADNHLAKVDVSGVQRTISEPTAAGDRLFARYVHAANSRGYCGPELGSALQHLACGHAMQARAGLDVPAAARRFCGVWPYQVLIAEQLGLADPLAEQVVRAYWTGNDLTEQVDTHRLRRQAAT